MRLQDHDGPEMIATRVGKLHAPQEFVVLGQVTGNMGQVKGPLAVVALVKVVLVLEDFLAVKRLAVKHANFSFERNPRNTLNLPPAVTSSEKLQKKPRPNRQGHRRTLP